MKQKTILNMQLVYPGFFKKLFSIIFLIQFMSCAKVSYLYHQGIGQLNIHHRAKENTQVLSDPKIRPENKDKIKLVLKAKEYFYKYFQRHETSLYSETAILDQDAVSYLVIASEFNKIEAKKECFPFMGCFPYLGFFRIDHAKDYMNKLKANNYFVYLRPVYAYSTLGHFSDPILSSFFHYNEFELVELIFHELFHTIYFIKNEVDLNENLADFFANMLTFKYFNYSDEAQNKYKRQQYKHDQIRLKIVDLIKEHKDNYEKNKPLNKSQAIKLNEIFLENKFLPTLKKLCSELDLNGDDCYPMRIKWNNASFAAFMTYSKDSEKITRLYKKLGLSLFDFFTYIEEKYKEYNDSEQTQSFSNFLLD